ncbi:hypothetical protein EVAR_96427_1, partial [Eumeta japonica]
CDERGEMCESAIKREPPEADEPRAMQKVPSLSDLSDPEASLGRGRRFQPPRLFHVTAHYALYTPAFTHTDTPSERAADPAEIRTGLRNLSAPVSCDRSANYCPRWNNGASVNCRCEIVLFVYASSRPRPRAPRKITIELCYGPARGESIAGYRSEGLRGVALSARGRESAAQAAPAPLT